MPEPPIMPRIAFAMPSPRPLCSTDQLACKGRQQLFAAILVGERKGNKNAGRPPSALPALPRNSFLTKPASMVQRNALLQKCRAFFGRNELKRDRNPPIVAATTKR